MKDVNDGGKRGRGSLWKLHFLLIFWWYWGLDSVPLAYYIGALSLEPCPQSTTKFLYDNKSSLNKVYLLKNNKIRQFTIYINEIRKITLLLNMISSSIYFLANDTI
jgi:hypothetical protein